MDDYQRVWITFLIPTLFIYALIEIKRGWNILKHKKVTLNFAYNTQIWLVSLFHGKNKSIEYKNKLLNNTSEMRLSGFYSLCGGVTAIAVCILWIYLLVKL